MSYRWLVGLTSAFIWWITVAGSTHAEQNLPVSDGRFVLETRECSDTLIEGVRRLIDIEVGDLLYGEAEKVPAGSDSLTIRCVGNIAWIEASGATETSPLEKLLRLDDFPGDAAARALALAGLELMAARSATVRARMDSKRNSPAPPITAASAPQPPPAPTPTVAPPVASPKASVSSREARIGMAGSWRAFPSEHGPSLWGGQVQASVRVRRIGLLAADADISSARHHVMNLGEVSALLLSYGTTFGVQTRGNFGTGFGLGGRVGMVRLAGSSANSAEISAATVWRPWGGPMAAARVFGGFGRVTLNLIAEVGLSVLEPAGQAGGAEAISLRGPWTAVYLGASVLP